jgi:hypothetical protein
MSQRIRISARAAEDLLSGAHVATPHTRLAATLRAAAGPTRPGELAGRQAAMAAFQRAWAHPAESPQRRSIVRTALLKLLTFKAAVVAAVVIGTGGVALAAGTGALPNPLNDHHSVPSASGTPQPDGRTDASQHPGNGDPSPSLVGLCHAYVAGAGSDHGKALDSPAFQALITAAGGKDQVDGFCTRLLATPEPDQSPDAHPSDRASHPDHPSHPAHPTDEPSARPSK